MTTKTAFEPVPDSLIAQAKAVNLIDLAGRYVELRKKSAKEYCGPCPKCGGDDRFSVQVDKFLCRQCHPKWGDTVEFESWKNGYSFRQAVANLTGAELPGVKLVERSQPVVKRTAATKPARRSSTWNAGAKARLLARMQENLFADVGKPGQTYLGNRALEPHVWLAYGLGFNPNANGKGPAIAIPWYKVGRLVGIRYRHIEPVDGQKMSSETGSTYGGILFGGQALPSFANMPPEPGRKSGEMFRSFVLCEGEFNDMSIYQIAHETAVDVLSVGSESATIPKGIVSYAQRYVDVFTWFDKPERALEAALLLPGSHAIYSPNGQDANDLLQAGRLGGFLSAIRLKACGGDTEKLERLKWNLWDAARLPSGIDEGSRCISNDLI